MSLTRATRHDYILVLAFFLLSLALYFLPTGFGEKVV